MFYLILLTSNSDRLCQLMTLELFHRIGKEQKAHSFDLFDAAATRRNARAPTAAMLLPCWPGHRSQINRKLY